MSLVLQLHFADCIVDSQLYSVLGITFQYFLKFSFSHSIFRLNHTRWQALMVHHLKKELLPKRFDICLASEGNVSFLTGFQFGIVECR